MTNVTINTFRAAAIALAAAVGATPAAAQVEYPLHQAAGHGFEYRLKTLLAAGADPNAVHEGALFGWTPLHAAIGGTQDARIVHILLGAGADPNIAEFGGQTPLHFAVIQGYGDIVLLLLAAGADTDIADSEGNTPLALAVEFGRQGIVRILQAAGARLN